MNLISLFFVFLCVALCHGAKPEVSENDSPFREGLDLDAILSNARTVSAYIKCINEIGSCTIEGRRLKNFMNKALKTSCSACNELEKKGVMKVIGTLQEKYPADWKKISDKWDPDGKLLENFEKANPGLRKQVFH